LPDEDYVFNMIAERSSLGHPDRCPTFVNEFPSRHWILCNYRVLFFACYAQRLLWNSYLSNDSGVLEREVIGHNLKNLFPLRWWRLGLHPEWLQKLYCVTVF